MKLDWFQVYNSMIHHLLYIVHCVPKVGFLKAKHLKQLALLMLIPQGEERRAWLSGKS